METAVIPVTCFYVSSMKTHRFDCILHSFHCATVLLFWSLFESLPTDGNPFKGCYILGHCCPPWSGVILDLLLGVLTLILSFLPPCQMPSTPPRALASDQYWDLCEIRAYSVKVKGGKGTWARPPRSQLGIRVQLSTHLDDVKRVDIVVFTMLYTVVWCDCRICPANLAFLSPAFCILSLALLQLNLCHEHLSLSTQIMKWGALMLQKRIWNVLPFLPVLQDKSFPTLTAHCEGHLHVRVSHCPQVKLVIPTCVPGTLNTLHVNTQSIFLLYKDSMGFPPQCSLRSHLAAGLGTRQEAQKMLLRVSELHQIELNWTELCSDLKNSRPLVGPLKFCVWIGFILCFVFFYF